MRGKRWQRLGLRGFGGASRAASLGRHDGLGHRLQLQHEPTAKLVAMSGRVANGKGPGKWRLCR